MSQQPYASDIAAWARIPASTAGLVHSTTSTPLSVASLRSVQATLWANAVRPAIQPAYEVALEPAQLEIRRRLLANERKRKRGYKGAKPRGSKWILQQQAMCALYGHQYPPFSTDPKCIYCKAVAA